MPASLEAPYCRGRLIDQAMLHGTFSLGASDRRSPFLVLSRSNLSYAFRELNEPLEPALSGSNPFINLATLIEPAKMTVEKYGDLGKKGSFESPASEGQLSGHHMMAQKTIG
jgi:hypothetical protein